MHDQATAPTTNNGTRHVVTRDGYRIAMPLPAARATIVRPAGGNRRVSTVRREIEAALNRGCSAVCPITGRLVRIYRRGLHQGQVRTLERLDRHGQVAAGGWIHLAHFTARRDGDFAKLVAWGLIEALPEEQATAVIPPDKNGRQDARGWWRCTERGRQWLLGGIRIPRQVAILHDQVLGYVDESDLIAPGDCPTHFSREALAAGDDGKAIA